MALGRSSRFQSNFAGWLVYFMMHRFKCHMYTECMCDVRTIETDVQCNAQYVYTHRCVAGDIERTKWYRCYFIEIENYEKHTHISLENIVSSIFCSSLVRAKRNSIQYTPPHVYIVQFFFVPFRSNQPAFDQWRKSWWINSGFISIAYEMKYVQRTSCALWILFIVLITFARMYPVLLRITYTHFPTNAFNSRWL